MIITFYSGENNTILDNSKVVGLSLECKMFDEVFKLGSTPCYCVTLEILKGSAPYEPGQITKVYINDTAGSRFSHYFYLDEVNTDDDVVEKYTLVDSMIKFNFNYDGSDFINAETRTLLDVLLNICEVAGVSTDITGFNGSDKIITWYDNTISAREYIGYIAELAGGYAYINASDKLVFGDFVNSDISTTVALEETSGYKIGEYHVLTRVLFDNSDVVYEAGTDTGNTVYLNPGNVYITSQADVDAIYNAVKNFNFYSVKIDQCPIPKVPTIGWKVNLTLNGSITYTFIAQIQFTYMLGWQGGYDCMLANQEQEETQVVDTNTKIRTIKTIMDRENGKFTREIAELNDDVNGEDGVVARVSTVEQTVEQISQTVSETSKEVRVIDTNLLLDTNAPTLNAVYADHNRYISDAGKASIISGKIVEITDTPFGTRNGAEFEVIGTATAATSRSLCWYSGGTVCLVAGKQYTMSCWARVVEAGTNDIQMYFGYGVSAYRTKAIDMINTEWQQYSWTFTADGSALNDSGGTRVYCSGLRILTGETQGKIQCVGFQLISVEDATIIAQATADGAASTADGALDLANTNAGAIETLNGVVAETKTNLQTQIAQNKEAINLRATKTEVTTLEDSLGNQIASVEETMQGQINVTNDNVATLVTKTTTIGDQVTKIGSAFVVEDDGAKVMSVANGTVNTNNYTQIKTDGMHIAVNNTEVAWQTADGSGTPQMTIAPDSTATSGWQFRMDSENRLNINWHS